MARFWLAGIGPWRVFLRGPSGRASRCILSRQFIVKARGTPTDADGFRAGVGTGPRVEFLVQILADALFVAQGHREDTSLHLVLERGGSYSRIVTFDGARLGTLPGLHEAALVEAIAGPLAAAAELGKDAQLETGEGVLVRATSFEHFVRELAESHPLFLLDPKGAGVNVLRTVSDPVFVLTDHTPLPRNTARWLRRIGAEPLSLGSNMLFASQCVTLLHGVLDEEY